MELNKDKVKKFSSAIKRTIGKGVKAYDRYQKEAPMRRQSQIKDLKQQIEVAKLKKQLSKYKDSKKENTIY